MPNIKIIAICGKSGAGKDAILRQLAKFKNTKRIVSCTTRPLREGEQEGIDYFCLTHEQFIEKILNGDMLEATVFNYWNYGTMKSALDENEWNIGIFNPESIEILQENRDLDLRIFYIYTPDKLRLLRQLQREDDPDCHEIIRRFSTDEQDFQFLNSRFDFIQLDNIADGDQILCANRIAKICHLDRCD